MSNLFISRFSPSLMSPDDLRGIFVQRSALLKDLEEGLENSIATESKHHYLLVGPRGIGKTHFLSLLFHDLDRLHKKKNFLVAWLREEEWVSSFLDLTMRIIRAIGEWTTVARFKDHVEYLYTLPPEEAEQQVANLLLEIMGSRTLIIFIENLQDIFQAIGDEGQKRLRALIQQSSQISIVASTPNLFGGISLRTSPFYGFFEVHHLTELGVTDAKALLSLIAEREGNPKLASFIQSAEGQAKVEAFYHLAGGNHRTYIILSQFLKEERIDDLVEPFIKMLDDLTPYYQSQIAALSPQQRQIVQFLCDRRYAVSVKEIATRCFMTAQTASSQLKILKDQEFVRSIQVGRESRYEVREPLMRFCMEMKQSRGTPVRLLVEFLQTWYSSRELNRLLEITSPTANLTKKYLIHALQKKETSPQQSKNDLKAQVKQLEEELKLLVRDRKLEGMQEVLKEIAEKRGTAEDYDKLSFCLAVMKQWLPALRNCEIALTKNPYLESAQFHKQLILLELGRFEECLAISDSLIKKNKNDSKAWDYRGVSLMSAGNPTEAFKAFEQCIQLDPGNSEAMTRAAATLIKQGKFDDALSWLDRAIGIDHRNGTALGLKGFVLAMLERNSEGLSAFEKALKIDEYDEQAWLGKGLILLNTERYQEAITCCERAMDLDKDFLPAHFYRVVCLFALQNWTGYMHELESLIKHCRKLRKDSIGEVGAILRLLLEKYSEPLMWIEKLSELLLLFEQYHILPQLATGLSNTVPSLVSDLVTDNTAHSWVVTSNELFSERQEFAVSLRLLKTAIDYRHEPNRDVTTELVYEERKLFQNLVEQHLKGLRNLQMIPSNNVIFQRKGNVESQK